MAEENKAEEHINPVPVQDQVSDPATAIKRKLHFAILSSDISTVHTMLALYPDLVHSTYDFVSPTMI
jgi:hypothetical protein